MGILNCCHRPIEEYVLETHKNKNNNDGNINDFKDKGEYPLDSEPPKIEAIEENINKNSELKSYPKEKEDKLTLKQNANIIENKQSIEKEENNKNNKNQIQLEEEQENNNENGEENNNNEKEEINNNNINSENINENVEKNDNNNEFIQIGNNLNYIENNEQFDLNNLNIESEQNFDNINLNNFRLDNYNNYNQNNENEEYNKYYEQSSIQQSIGTANFDVNQNENSIENNINKIGFNNFSLATSNSNYAIEDENNLNKINLYNSSFTFGDPIQLKGSLTGSYNYNYDYYSPDSTTKLY